MGRGLVSGTGCGRSREGWYLLVARLRRYPTVMDLISAMAEEEGKTSSCSALQAVVSEFSAPEDSGNK
ncbi:unnamed protein product [Arctogadus glacialis]